MYYIKKLGEEAVHIHLTKRGVKITNCETIDKNILLSRIKTEHLFNARFHFEKNKDKSKTMVFT